MTAREKFIARLKELGLYEEWRSIGDFAGKVIKDGVVLVFCHYEHDPKDNYTESRYPSYDELRDIEAFRKECEDRFYENDDDKFVAALARWLHYEKDECPLYPVDLYWSELDLGEEVITFEDDPADVFTESIVEMVRYIAEKTGKDVNGEINGIKI